MKKIVSIMICVVFFISLLPQIVLGASEIVITANDPGYQEIAAKPDSFKDSGLKDANGGKTRYATMIGDKMIYTPNIPEAGRYTLYYFSVQHEASDANQLIIVNAKDEEQAFTVDCVKNSGWLEVGTFEFEQGEKGNIATIKTVNSGGSPYMRSGGVKFVKGEGKGAVAVPAAVPSLSGEGNAAQIESPVIGTAAPKLPVKAVPKSNNVMKEFFVSVTGDDNNDGSQGGAFKTLEKAKEAVSKINADMTGDIVVNLMGGIYYLDKTFALNEKDGGQGGYNIIYQSMPGQTATLSGGIEKAGFRVHENGIYKIEVGKNLKFRQIYIDGDKGVRARTPNDDYFKFEQEQTDKGLILDRTTMDSLTNVEGVEVNVLISFMHKQFPLVDKNGTEGIVKNEVFNSFKDRPQASKKVNGKEYWLENSYEFLDAEGEWFYDKNEGIVYYMPYSNQSMDNAKLTIPMVEVLFKTEKTKNLVIRGIEFAYTNWLYPLENGIIDMQANFLIPPSDKILDNKYSRYGFEKGRTTSALTIEKGDTILVYDCMFHKLGGSGLSFRNGGKYFYIIGNTFDNIAGSGIEIGEDFLNLDDKSVYSYHVLIDNNLIQNVANEYYGGIGILTTITDGLTITNNHLKDLAYTGISSSWGWSSSEFVPENRDYTIKNNLVENYSIKITDSGGIYVPNPVGGTNIIENNYVKGNFGSLDKRVVMGIYHDGASKNWTTQNNVVEYIQHWWIGGGTFGAQIKSDILAQNNYTTAEDARLLEGVKPEANVVVKDTIVDVNAIWNNDATKIKENAGLKGDYKNLFGKLDGYEIFSQRAAYIEPKESKEFIIETSYPAQIMINNTNSDIIIEEIENNKDYIGAVINSLMNGENNSKIDGKVALLVDSPNGIVNGVANKIDSNNEKVVPKVVNGRTLLPVRYLANSIGAAVDWNAEASIVTLTRGSDVITIKTGDMFLTLNGLEIPIDVPADTIEDRLMLPLRSITEPLGKKVFWDNRGLIVISDFENPLSIGSKTIKVTMTEKPKTIIYDIGVSIIDQNGKEMKEHIGILTRDVNLGIAVTINDKGYKEVGTFADSGLAGYNTKSRYNTTFTKDTYATFAPDKIPAKKYQVYVYKIAHSSSDDQAFIEVTAGGKTYPGVIMDGSKGTSDWFYVGDYEFDGSGNEFVKISSSGQEDKFIRTSCVKFLEVE